MTKLALINNITYRKDINEVGDIVGIYPDSHAFSDHEKEVFEIVDVPETKTVLDIIVPETKNLTKSATIEWTDVEPDRKMVWKDTDGGYKDIVVQPKYHLMYNADKKEIKETYSRYAENLTVQSIASVEATKE